jgi:chromosome segregation ATPase
MSIVLQAPHESCFQRTIRMPLVYSATRNCQALAVLIGLVASVAGFYFASKQGPQLYYALSIGVIGVMIMTHSSCGLSMIIDYQHVLQQSRRVYSLEQAKKRLEEQVEALDRMEQGIAKEGDDVKAQLDILKGQLEIFERQIAQYESCLKELGCSQLIIEKLKQGLAEEQKKFAVGVTHLTHAAAAASYVHDSAQRSRTEAIGAIELIERRLSDKEKELLETIRSIEWEQQLEAMKRAIGAFKTESPAEYAALIERFPELTV